MSAFIYVNCINIFYIVTSKDRKGSIYKQPPRKKEMGIVHASFEGSIFQLSDKDIFYLIYSNS